MCHNVSFGKICWIWQLFDKVFIAQTQATEILYLSHCLVCTISENGNPVPGIMQKVHQKMKVFKSL